MQFEQYRQPQMNDYDIKKVAASDYENVKSVSTDSGMNNLHGSVNSYSAAFFKSSVDEQNHGKVEDFKSRLNEFRKIGTLQEAQALLSEIMPVKTERTTFNVGNAKCIIINKDNLLRITLDSDKEFISFSFQ